jgi:hypothetical protein
LSRRYERPARPPALIADLLRDANPTWRERQGRPNLLELRDAHSLGRPIEDRPDPMRAQDVAERCANATAELLRLYREARKDGLLGELDYRVRFFCERLKLQNRGKLPGAKNKALRPRRRRGPEEDEHFKLLIHLAVLDEIAKRGGKRGAVKQALESVAERYARSRQTVRGIYYDRSPEWQRDVELALALRAWPDTQP